MTEQDPGGPRRYSEEELSKMSEEELKELYLEQYNAEMRQVQVQDLVAQSLITLINIGARRAGIVPVPQPVFLYTFGDYFRDYLGEPGTHGRFQFADLLREGWLLTGSSDVWVGSEREATNPLFSIWCCLRRQTYDERLIDPEQAISVEDALRMHTINGARVLGEADEKGSLEPGKLADAVVLARDPTTAAIDDLPSIRVERVLLGGADVPLGGG